MAGDVPDGLRWCWHCKKVRCSWALNQACVESIIKDQQRQSVGAIPALHREMLVSSSPVVV